MDTVPFQWVQGLEIYVAAGLPGAPEPGLVPAPCAASMSESKNRSENPRSNAWPNTAAKRYGRTLALPKGRVNLTRDLAKQSPVPGEKNALEQSYIESA